MYLGFLDAGGIFYATPRHRDIARRSDLCSRLMSVMQISANCIGIYRCSQGRQLSALCLRDDRLPSHWFGSGSGHVSQKSENKLSA